MFRPTRCAFLSPNVGSCLHDKGWPGHLAWLESAACGHTCHNYFVTCLRDGAVCAGHPSCEIAPGQIAVTHTRYDPETDLVWYEPQSFSLDHVPKQLFVHHDNCFNVRLPSDAMRIFHQVRQRILEEDDVQDEADDEDEMYWETLDEDELGELVETKQHELAQRAKAWQPRTLTDAERDYCCTDEAFLLPQPQGVPLPQDAFVEPDTAKLATWINVSY